MNVLAQVIAIIALTMTFISYQQKNKKKFLFFQILASLSYSLQYFVLGALSGAITDLISLGKNVIFYKDEEKGKITKFNVFITIEIIVIICGIITYQNVFSLLPIFITIINTYGNWQKNLKVSYMIGFLNSILWIIYNVAVGAYVLIINCIIELIGSIIGIIKISKRKQS